MIFKSKVIHMTSDCEHLCIANAKNNAHFLEMFVHGLVKTH